MRNDNKVRFEWDDESEDDSDGKLFSTKQNKQVSGKQLESVCHHQKYTYKYNTK